MKKTIRIHISGYIFNIEEDAYAILEDCGLRALIESLMVDKKFKINEWKVYFLKGKRG